MDEIFQKLFPDLSFPPRIELLLSGVTLSRQDLSTASPRKLADPFSLPGLNRLVSRLHLHHEYRKPIRISPSPPGDALLSRTLFLRLFRGLRRLILAAPAGLKSPAPHSDVLDLADPAGLRYTAAAGEEIFVPATGAASVPYSRTGLIFKLGQAWQLFNESDFNQDYVAFDLETTGMSPGDSEIMEIGAVRIRNGSLGEEFHSFVRPSQPIPPEISSVTGITDEDVRDALPLKEILRSFCDFIGDAVLVAHNVEYDFGFLRHYTRKSLGVNLKNKTYDTLAQARCRFPGISHRLKNVAEHLDIELKSWHRASADARAAAAIFNYFREQDRAAERHAFFKEAAPLTCLGTLLARVPLKSDNAIFFRYGFPAIFSSFQAAEKYFQKHPDRKEEVRPRIEEFLAARRAKKQDLAIHQIVDKIIQEEQGARSKERGARSEEQGARSKEIRD